MTKTKNVNKNHLNKEAVPARETLRIC